MVGGDAAIIDRLNPLFAAMGKKIFRMGETGKGQATKLAMNLQIALIFEGFRRGPHPRHQTRRGPQTTSVLDRCHHGPLRRRRLQRTVHPAARLHANFPLRLMHKDILLTLEAAKEARVKLPALETVEEIYEMATEDGHRDLDYAATLTLLEKWAEYK